MRVLAAGFAGATVLAIGVLFYAWFVKTDVWGQWETIRAMNREYRDWSRKAVDVDYEECRSRPASCLDKIVVWPVTHYGESDSRYQDKGSDPVLWRNEARVPRRERSARPFRAVALVTNVGSHGIELSYIGSPDIYDGFFLEKIGLNEESH